ncbi:MAG: hypothetical protein KGM24_13160 [Elusimicrobia bacterium]|nr:hypothetical protein [Elusimicrobiota bacterium]
MKSFSYLIALTALLAGCSSITVVNNDNHPNVSSFTVIPNLTIPENALGSSHLFDTTEADTDFSNFVERVIMSFGLRVIERPPFKFLQTTSSDKSPNVGTTSARTMDVVAMENDTKADYIVITYEKDNSVRIIRRSDRTLMASFSLDTNPETAQSQVHSALVAANLLKDKWTVSSCRIKR